MVPIKATVPVKSRGSSSMIDEERVSMRLPVFSAELVQYAPSHVHIACKDFFKECVKVWSKQYGQILHSRDIRNILEQVIIDSIVEEHNTDKR